MKLIFKNILKTIGVKEFTLMVLDIVEPELVMIAKKTEKTELDDRAVEVLFKTFRELLKGN